MQRIFKLLMLAAVIIAGAVWYVHWSKNRALNSGNVVVRDQSDAKGTPSTAVTPPANKTEPADKAAPATQGQVAKAAIPQDDSIKAQTHDSPATPTVSNAPSGTQPKRTLVAGSARYQLYRQGDITWRLNTESGQTCVLLATEAQWSKTLVYERGCGAS